jgi:hypothetical protein
VGTRASIEAKGYAADQAAGLLGRNQGEFTERHEVATHVEAMTTEQLLDALPEAVAVLKGERRARRRCLVAQPAGWYARCPFQEGAWRTANTDLKAD